MRLPVIELTPTTSRPAGMDSGPRSIGAVRVLRLSITDRCNYRCVYCMPEEGVAWLPKEHILSFEEIADVVRAAIDLHGIRRFKLTGGEPTVRHGLVDLVALLRRIPGIEDLSLTTNGQRLLDLAGPLKEAGLDRVTVSLDSLKPDRFKQITRTGDLHAVLAGIDRAADVGFGSLKINCVTMRGTNDDELADFARLSIDRPLTVRFIEYMPLGDAAVMHGKNDEVGTMNDEQKTSGVHRSSFILLNRAPPAGAGPRTAVTSSSVKAKHVGRSKLNSDRCCRSTAPPKPASARPRSIGWPTLTAGSGSSAPCRPPSATPAIASA